MFKLTPQDEKNLEKLSITLYEQSDYSKENVSGQDAMRKLMYDALGIEQNGSRREFKRAYDQNKGNMFAVIDIAVNAVMPRVVQNEFDNLANFHTIGAGDVPRFRNPNTELFRVARIASGTQDIRRQTGLASSYTVPTEWYAAATYVEFEQFLTGQVDWQGFIQRIAQSFALHISETIYKAFIDSYSSVGANVKSTGAFDVDTLLQLVRHVRAQSGGSDVTVYTTATTLAKISRALELSETMKDELNNLGFLSVINGIQFAAFPDLYKAGTEEFLVKDDALLIIPTGEKIVDVVFEGETYTYETESSESSSLQMDFKTEKKLGIQVNQSAIYGYYSVI